MEQNDAPLYYVWGIDQVAYGPVELPTLVNWIRDERVEKDTWIFDQRGSTWTPAAELTELQAVFSRKAALASPGPNVTDAIRPGSLRRIKVLAGLSDEHLLSFAHYVEVVQIPQFNTVVKAGETGDSMFMLMEGELRVRVMVHGKESILSTLEPGESFGELALLDEGTRSADVVANVPSTALKITKDGLKQLFQEAPALAAPFLHALCRMVSARLRSTNKRMEDSVRLSREAA